MHSIRKTARGTIVQVAIGIDARVTHARVVGRKGVCKHEVLAGQGWWREEGCKHEVLAGQGWWGEEGGASMRY